MNRRGRVSARNWTIRLGHALSRMVRRGPRARPIPQVELNSDLRRFFCVQVERDRSATLATAKAELLANPAAYTHGPPGTRMSAAAVVQLLLLERARGASTPLRAFLGGD